MRSPIWRLREALGDQLEDPRSWSVSRARALVLLRRLAQPVEHARRDRRDRAATRRRRRAGRLDDVGAPDLLEQVAGGAGHDRLEQRLVVGERREHEALDLRVLRPDLAAHLDAVAVGQPDVEHRDVGAAARDPAPAPRPRPRLRRRPRCRPRPRAVARTPSRTTSWSSSRNTRIGSPSAISRHRDAPGDGRCRRATLRRSSDAVERLGSPGEIRQAAATVPRRVDPVAVVGDPEDDSSVTPRPSRRQAAWRGARRSIAPRGSRPAPPSRSWSDRGVDRSVEDDVGLEPGALGVVVDERQDLVTQALGRRRGQREDAGADLLDRRVDLVDGLLDPSPLPRDVPARPACSCIPTANSRWIDGVVEVAADALAVLEHLEPVAVAPAAGLVERERGLPGEARHDLDVERRRRTARPWCCRPTGRRASRRP